MKKAKNINPYFGEAFTQMMYERMAGESGRALEKQLKRLPAYKEAWEAIEDAVEAGALSEEIYQLREIEAQFYYRLGIQDGISMKDAAFLTVGL